MTLLMFASRSTVCINKSIADSEGVNAKSSFGATPLTHAALDGNLSGIKTLIAHGADVNARDNKGHNAIWWAILLKHYEAVKLLRKAGAPSL